MTSGETDGGRSRLFLRKDGMDPSVLILHKALACSATNASAGDRSSIVR